MSPPSGDGPGRSTGTRRRLIWRILGGSGLILLVLGTGLLWTRADLEVVDDEFVDIIDKDLVMARGAAELLRFCVDMETAVRGFVSTGREVFLDPYVKAKQALPKLVIELRRVGRRSSKELSIVAHVDGLMRRWDAEVAVPMLERRRQGRMVTPDRIELGRSILEEVRGQIAELDGLEHARVQRRRQHALDLANRSSMRVYISMTLALFVALGVGLYLARDIAGALAHITSAMGALVRGDDVELDVRRQDEIGTLAKNFVEMARALRDKEQELTMTLRELQGLNRELVVASRVKGEFLAAMSHELRTPLNSIIGFTELLVKSRNANGSEEMADTLGRVLRNAQHLLTLINDVLDMAKMDAGKMSVRALPFDLLGPVQAALAIVEPLAKDKDLAVDAKLPDRGPIVQGDPQRAQQVLLNLISNAVKFTDQGQVRVDLGTAGERAVVRVSDTGVGIPSHGISQLFEEFHQVESGDGRSFGGTGLGLALSRRLARAMGGEVTYEPGAQGGSTFTFSMPLSKATPATLAATTEGVLVT